ncbi:MAG: phage tail protein [Candidatus Brocadiae bacterium]|nr:phage tail protein [Candidatus Brocadiia bacterium]
MNFFPFSDLPENVRLPGICLGIVTNNQDPDKLGRVKVKFPRISLEHESEWARVASLMAGKDRGLFFLPEVDDEVLVIFENGDITRPYVIGALWNGKDTPPCTNEDGKNDIRLIKSRSGHIVRLTDKEGEEKIEIIDKTAKNKITIDCKENIIAIECEKDINITAKGAIAVTAEKDITITTKAKFAVDAQEIALVSKAKVGIQGSQIEVKASGNTDIKGAAINLN